MRKFFIGLKIFRMVDSAVDLITKDGVVEYEEIKLIAVPLLEKVIKLLGYDVKGAKVTL